mgnify:CR=1 FL=1
MFSYSDTILKKIFNILSDYTIRSSDLTVVTNDFLCKDYIKKITDSCFVLPDKIPELKTNQSYQLDSNKINFVFITSFGRDEPIGEFLSAISELQDSYFFYITGNYKKNIESLAPKGRNYLINSFIDDDKYIALLKSCDATVVLTKHEYTLTCGAYESLFFEKPMILSNTKTIRGYFSKGCVYTDSDSNSIKEAIVNLDKNFEAIHLHLLNLKKELYKSWQIDFENL